MSRYYFTHEQDHHILICHKCGIGLGITEVYEHLSKAHKDNVIPQARRDIEAELRQLPGVKAHISAFEHPRAPVPAIAGLPVMRDYAMCLATPTCRHIMATSRNNQAAHLSSSHNIHASSPRGRPNPGSGRVDTNQYWRYNVACQRVRNKASKGGKEASYFEVLVTAPSQPAAVNPTDFTTFFNSGASTIANVLQQQLDTVPFEDDHHTSAWLHKTKFRETLAGHSFEHLKRLISSPRKGDDPHAIILWNCIRNLGLVWQNTVDAAGEMLRKEVMRNEMHSVITQPLEAYANHRNDKVHVVQEIFMFTWQTVGPPKLKAPRYFALTDQQKKVWRHLQTNILLRDRSELEAEVSQPVGGRCRLTHLEDLCQNFYLSLLGQHTNVHEQELAFYNILAVQGVHAHGFLPPSAYCTNLGAQIKFARFCVLQHATDPFQDDPPAAAATDDEQSESEVSDDSVSEEQSDAGTDVGLHSATKAGPIGLAKTLMNAYMIRGTNTTMTWMVDCLSYGYRIAYSTAVEGFTHWDGNKLTCRSAKLEVHEFTAMVSSMYSDAKAALFRTLYIAHDKELPRIPWEDLVDDLCNQSPGYSFLSEPLNSAVFGGGDTWLAKRIDNKGSSSHFVSPSGHPNKGGIEAFGRQVNELAESLKSLAYLTVGPPPRGTELESAQYKNSITGELRNVFCMRNHLAIILRYHKGFNKSKTPKIIHRFLPREVANLFVWYLWLVLPFHQSMQAHVGEGPDSTQIKRAISPLLWPDKEGKRSQNSFQLREELRLTSNKYLGQTITTQLWRHIIIAIGRKMLEVNVDEYFDATDFANIDEEESEAFEKQAGHSPEIAHNVYAKLIGEMAESNSFLANSFYRTCVKWHMLQEWPSAMQQKERRSPSHKRKRTATDIPNLLQDRQPTPPAKASEIPLAKMQRARAHEKINIFYTLSHMYGPDATFRGKQVEAIQAIMAGESPVVLVEPTGGGKSLAFMLPAFSRSYGLTVVFLPLVILQLNIRERCKELNVPCEIWSISTKQHHFGIVLTTMETYDQSEDLQAYLSYGAANGNLARIVVDECHYPLITNHKFRSVFQRIGMLVALEVPLTLLTATLPPEEEQTLWTKLCIDPATIHMYRSPTTRSNIEYYVTEVPKEQARELLSHEGKAKYITHLLAQNQNQRAIVYLPYKADVIALAKSMGCFAMHSDTPDKEKVLAEYQMSTSSIMIATSCLSEGTHIPNVQTVVHMGAPESMIKYVQESGRGGRDVDRCRAVIVLAQGLPSHLSKQVHTTRARVQQYLQVDYHNKKCRRVAIDRYMDDNRVREHCLPHEAQCDICQQMTTSPETAQYISDEEGFNPILDGEVDDSRNSPSEFGSDIDVDDIAPLLDNPTPRTQAIDPSLLTTDNATITLVAPQSASGPSTSKAATSPSRLLGQTTTQPPDHTHKPNNIQATLLKQAAERRQQSARWQDKVKSDATVIETQAQLYEYWNTHCPACFFTGGDAFKHRIGACGGYRAAKTARERVEKIIPRGQFPPGTCHFCRRIYPLCPRWYSNKDGKWNQDMKISCKNDSVLKDAFNVLFGTDGLIRDEMMARVREATGPNPTDGDIHKYFVDKILLGKVEINNWLLDLEWVTTRFVKPNAVGA